MGGARSPDITDGILKLDDPKRLEKIAKLEAEGKYFYRTKGLDWFPEELPSEEELERGWNCLQTHGGNVDYILTHAAPSALEYYLFDGEIKLNRLTKYFELVRRKINFHTWYCGHYHIDQGFILQGKKYEILYHKIKKIC